MVYITGDTHGEMERFDPHGVICETLKAQDTLIICGDFGFVWSGNATEQKQLDLLAALPFSIAFVSGNHENFDLLYTYPTEYWHGGRVRVIRPNIRILLRGEFYYIEGHSYFCMGGAACHDIDDGILNESDPEYCDKLIALRSCGGMYRINHRSWWARELPSEAEYANALENLNRQWWQVDSVITHCAPSDIQQRCFRDFYPTNQLTDFLESVSAKLSFTRWFFGHYHMTKRVSDKFMLIYEDIQPIAPATGDSVINVGVDAELLQKARAALAAQDLSIEEATIWFFQKCVACPQKATDYFKALCAENAEQEDSP